jgi:two-component system NtrC family response regulator
MAERILVIDDEAYMLELLGRIIKEHTTYGVDTTQSPVEALAWLAERDYDLALLDLKMPEMDGMQVLGRIRELPRPCGVIIVTAYGTIRSAVQAMKEGALDYVTKPFDTDEILIAIDRAVRLRRLERENRLLREQIEERLRSDYLLGASEQILRLGEEIRQVATAPVPVLIEGEVGTGKELVARVIHNASAHAQEPFVAFFCGGLSAAAAEAELFGQPGGAKRGLAAEAAGGTLYLAEVGQLAASVQARLVRLLQEGRYEQPSGELAAAECRLIASTTENLTELVRSGRFSQDLLFRLNTIHLILPPLRARKEDIPMLAHHFVQRFCGRYGRPELELSPGALEWLLAQEWPGNVRELQNVIERGVVLAADGEVRVEDLFPSDYLNSVIYSPEAALFTQPLGEARREATAAFGKIFEGEYLRLLLSRSKGDVAAAAKESGLKEAELEAMLASHELDPSSFKRGLL